jgi:hypothetical protein
MPQRNLYVVTASRTAAPCVVPPQVRDTEVEMNAAYPPLYAPSLSTSSIQTGKLDPNIDQGSTHPQQLSQPPMGG